MDNLNPDIPTSNDGGQPGAGDGQSNQNGTSIKDVISSTLGRTFASDEAALKAVKDTFSYVGMKPQDALKQMANDPLFAEDIKKMVGANNTPMNTPSSNANGQFVPVEEYMADKFFNANPELSSLRDEMVDIARATGKSLQDIAAMETFKSAQAFAKSQKAKSVLETNPRLGHVTDKLSRAKEFVAQGNHVAAQDTAVAAVLDAYNMK